MKATHKVIEYDGEIAFVGSERQCQSFRTGEQRISPLSEDEFEEFNAF